LSVLSRFQYWARPCKESTLLWNRNIWSKIWPTRSKSSYGKQRGHPAHQGETHWCSRFPALYADHPLGWSSYYVRAVIPPPTPCYR
jgi:hypothetical protein